MKNLLVVAYHFPPGGGPGVQRVLKHITYLPEFGWNPTVVTVENGEFPARDESLLAKIPANITVHRVPIYEPYTAYRRFLGIKDAAIDVNVNTKQRGTGKKLLTEFIRSTFFIPDARMFWRPAVVKKIKQIMHGTSFDAVYTSAPPYTCALIGRDIKRYSKLPWVMGLRDPWTDFLTTPNRWWLPKIIDKAQESSCLKEADIVECAWQGIIDDALTKVPSLNIEKLLHVPNGFDSSDFPQVRYVKNDKFTITYTGSMYGVRNPRTFLLALEELQRQDVLHPENVSLQFIGRFGDDVWAMFHSSSFASSIQIEQYVPHKTSLEYLMRSDVLLLIVDETKESSEIVPGKVYEYLGVRRPILALCSVGSAIENLVNQLSAGECAPNADVSLIASSISKLYVKWQTDNMPVPEEHLLDRFERKESAKTLAKALDSINPLGASFGHTN
jgi:hypothetical protein